MHFSASLTTTLVFCQAFYCVRDIEQDDDAYLGVVETAAREVYAMLKKGKIVLVHCHSGRNRSALVILVFCAFYTNLTFEDAVYRIRKYNSSRFSMQSTLKNTSFIAHVRAKWAELRES